MFFHIILKGEKLQQYAGVIRDTVWNFRKELKEDVRVAVDFNPQMVL